MSEGEGSSQASGNSFFGDEENKSESEENRNNIDFSKNSSNPEGIFDTLNKEIRFAVENCKDLSYNSNSKISEQQKYNEQFLDARYWWAKKSHEKYKINNWSNNIINNNNGQRDESQKKENDFEEKILYINDEDEKNNDNNDNDEFNMEDMEEKTIEKSENDINEINSIKVNNNNLNNKNQDNKKEEKSINKGDTTKTKDIVNEKEDPLRSINDKLNPSLTHNKMTPSLFNVINNNAQVHQVMSTFNNIPTSFNKGSSTSTNNSSNNKNKKDEEHCSSEIEEDNHANNNNNNEEIKNNMTYTHGNKFGPHLNNYNQLSSNNMNVINMGSTNLVNMNGMNTINNYNLGNSFLYNRIAKTNLNMIYYIPIQQQQILHNSNYMNTNKIFPNLNSVITDNNNINGMNLNNNNNKKTQVQVQTQENNTTVKNNCNNNTNSNLTNNTNENKSKKNSSSEEKNKNQLSNLLNSSNNNNSKTNNGFRKNDNNNNNNNGYNASSNSVQNLNNTASNNNKGEKNLLNLDDIVTGRDTRTTVMIRNIPIKCTEDILIEALEEFKGKYDCLYMPYDYEKNGNRGYAFINFLNPLHILYFHEKFCGKKWDLFESSKICELNSANIQGIYEIQKHSKNYKGFKKPLFNSELNNSNQMSEKMIIPSKYLFKLKIRFPKMKYHENKAKKIIVVDSFE